MENLKRTALYDWHVEQGGKIVDFAGYELPVQYTGLVEEHEAVRNRAGLFDVSHMGEVAIKGPQALDFVQYLVTNDVRSLVDQQIFYTFMCYENGGVVDDLLVYRKNEEDFFLVINAANIDKDVAWIEKHATAFDVTVENLSPSYAEVAIQGPKAQAILQKVTPKNLEEIAFFFFEEEVMVAGYPCLVSRTGYTGEDGFEVYATNEAIEPIVRALMDAGEEEGLVPCGLGARDTLRFEASLPLYGNELSPEITPLEAGLGFFVKLKVDDDFIGKQALVAQKEKGLERKIVGFELNDRGIPRHGYAVVDGEGESIGFVTTGYKSPTLGTTIGLAMVPIEQSEMGSTIHIDIRGKAKEATVVSKRFLKKNYKK